MIRITQVKLDINHKEEDLLYGISKALKISSQQIKSYAISKKSIDARKKNEIKYIYTIDVTIKDMDQKKEGDLIKRSKNPNVTSVIKTSYNIRPTGSQPLKHRPIIIGLGPAGLFCAYLLAKHGYEPLVIERGYEVKRRVTEVEKFWAGSPLNTECNVQFGEGGAGTFSDGKLNTMVKDPSNRYPFIMETFVEHGAPSEILYLNKPHIGTDKLRYVVESMRKQIIAMGGEVRFGTTVTDLRIEDGKICSVVLNGSEELPCEVLIPAIGHSARDTFQMFLNRGLMLTPKPFAIGFRMEHKQSHIGYSQYGEHYKSLAPADYKLTHQATTGRGVYSFCMCPGGFVVNSSSEEGGIAVNGMSNHLRDEDNANSAIVVTVGPEDFESKDPLGGIEFQRKYERIAYDIGRGKVPVQLFGDLLRNQESVTIGGIKPNIKGAYQLARLNDCLPQKVVATLIEGIQNFDHKIKGFANEEAVISGVETRTSSPVRIQRNEKLESNLKGIYPCGEGAGYAGGITSAAMDGIKVYEVIAERYEPIRF